MACEGARGSKREAKDSGDWKEVNVGDGSVRNDGVQVRAGVSSCHS